jgi:ABC-type uncharacterized transport system substrate-binding protein
LGTVVPKLSTISSGFNLIIDVVATPAPPFAAVHLEGVVCGAVAFIVIDQHKSWKAAIEKVKKVLG